MVDRPEPNKPGINDPGQGRRLGIDVGTVRIGTALSNREATLATPLETIQRQTRYKERDKADIHRLIAIVREYNVVEIVIGLPRDLRGNGSRSVGQAKEIAFRLRRRLKKSSPEVAIRFADERLTSVVAGNALRAMGKSTRQARSVIDQAAAVEILQSWLDGRIAYLAQHDPAAQEYTCALDNGLN